MSIPQDDIDRIATAHNYAHAAMVELHAIHGRVGPHTPLTPLLIKASLELAAVCSSLIPILRGHDEITKKERWRGLLLEQNHGTEG